MQPATDRNDLLEASRLLGVDVMFDRLVEVLVRGHDEDGSQAELLRRRLEEFHPKFQRLYCEIFVRHLGERGGRRVLAAFRQDGMQRYVSARQATVPAFEKGLAELRARMGETEL